MYENAIVCHSAGSLIYSLLNLLFVYCISYMCLSVSMLHMLASGLGIGNVRGFISHLICMDHHWSMWPNEFTWVRYVHFLLALFNTPMKYQIWGWTSITTILMDRYARVIRKPHQEPDIPSHKIQMPMLKWPLQKVLGLCLKLTSPKKSCCCENSQCFGELGFVRSQQAAKVKPWTQHSWPQKLRKMPGKWEEKMGNWKNGWICLRFLLGCSMLFQFFGWKTKFWKPDVWCWRSLQSSAAYFSGAAPGK